MITIAGDWNAPIGYSAIFCGLQVLSCDMEYQQKASSPL